MKKKILTLSFLSSFSVVAPAMVAISCGLNQKTIEAKATSEAKGFYPTTISQKLQEAKDSKTLLETIKKFISEEDYQKIDLTDTYIFDKENSIFINETTISPKAKRQATIVLKGQKNKYVIKISEAGKNNVIDVNKHEFDKDKRNYFWDGSLEVDGVYQNENKTGKITADEYVTKYKNNIDQFQDFFNLKIKNENGDELAKVNFESNTYKYELTSIHNHGEDILHYSIIRVNKKTKEIQRISNWISISGKFENHSHPHNSWPKTVGSLTFKGSLTAKGKNITASDFLDLAKQKENEFNKDSKKILEFLKEYIEIEGQIDTTKYSYKFYISEKTHTHGNEELHFYLQVHDQNDQKISDELENVELEIEGWKK